MILSIGAPLLSALFLLGCASAPPPVELVDARSAYEHAQASRGAVLTPVPLHEAKLALDAAEQAYTNDAESIQTRDLSYVATRKSQLAESRGNSAEAAARRDQAQRDLAQIQAQSLAQSQAGLTAAQGELSRTRDQLNMTAEQLATEKTARAAAEKRARDAMDKLGVAAALSVKDEPRGTVILLPGNVLFASGKWELLPGAREKLKAVAEALKNQEDHKIVVEGHTDSQGTETANLELGQKRAQSVRDYLVSQGVDDDHITSEGIGQSRPVADNKSPEGRANNRRVEIIVQPLEKR